MEMGRTSLYVSCAADKTDGSAGRYWTAVDCITIGSNLFHVIDEEEKYRKRCQQK
jgi:hypothetical protein